MGNEQIPTPEVLPPAPGPSTPPPTPRTSPLAQLLPELPQYLEDTIHNLQDDKNFIRNLTKEEKEAFIRSYVATGGLFLESCHAIKAPCRTVYLHLERDPEWTRALKQAKLSLGERLMSVSYKRAMEGNGVIDRMFQLQKRFFAPAYGDRPNVAAVQVNIDTHSVR